MLISCATLYERLAEYLPCKAWLWPASVEDFEEPLLQPPIQALSDCWVPPKSIRLDCVLPSSQTQQWPPGHLRTTGSSTGSWDIDTAHADRCSTPTSQAAAAHISSRQHSGTTAGSHDIQDAGEGIELRPTKANVLLGQYHMERSGQFVSAKPGRSLSHGRHWANKRSSWHLEDRGPAS